LLAISDNAIAEHRFSAPCTGGSRLADNLARRFVLADLFVDHLPRGPIFRRGQVLHFDDEFGPNPVNARKHQRRSKARRARRLDIERLRSTRSGRRHRKIGELINPHPVPIRPA
jgi:hypothetical protein